MSSAMQQKLQRLYRNAELIAKYYKYIGIISNQGENYRLNYKYEPKDFTKASKTALDFLDGASLGDENIIMFNEKEISEKAKQLQY